MTNKNSLNRQTLTESLALISSGDISCRDLVESYINQISNVNPRINAFITILEEEALRDADLADQTFKRTGQLGNLHGIPIGIKDQVHTAGILTTSASNIRSNFVPTQDATIVKRIKDAGGIIIGKLNMTEFAMGDPSTSYYGITHNPWGHGRDPGTSSTGAGAATSAFMAAASIGEDTGGSIRGPAANCGLVGIRPSWGLVSRFGLDGASWSLDTLGPLARSVEDTARVLQTIGGFDPKDPSTSSRPVPDYIAALTGNVKGMKIAVLHEFVDGPEAHLHPAVKTAINDAAEVFTKLGAIVDTISIPNASYAGIASRTISFVERVSINPEWIRERPEDFHPNTRTAFLTGELVPAQAYYKAQKMRDLIRKEVFETLSEYDVILMPSDESPAGMINTEPGFKTSEAANESLRKSMYRGLFSLVSGPALSIPCGNTIENGDTLPIGLQLASKPFNEAILFNCAYAFEQATKWHETAPPV